MVPATGRPMLVLVLTILAQYCSSSHIDVIYASYNQFFFNATLMKRFPTRRPMGRIPVNGTVISSTAIGDPSLLAGSSDGKRIVWSKGDWRTPLIGMQLTSNQWDERSFTICSPATSGAHASIAQVTTVQDDASSLVVALESNSGAPQTSVTSLARVTPNWGQQTMGNRVPSCNATSLVTLPAGFNVYGLAYDKQDNSVYFSACLPVGANTTIDHFWKKFANGTTAHCPPQTGFNHHLCGLFHLPLSAGKGHAAGLITCTTDPYGMNSVGVTNGMVFFAVNDQVHAFRTAYPSVIIHSSEKLSYAWSSWGFGAVTVDNQTWVVLGRNYYVNGRICTVNTTTLMIDTNCTSSAVPVETNFAVISSGTILAVTNEQVLSCGTVTVPPRTAECPVLVDGSVAATTPAFIGNIPGSKSLLRVNPDHQKIYEQNVEYTHGVGYKVLGNFSTAADVYSIVYSNGTMFYWENLQKHGGVNVLNKWDVRRPTIHQPVFNDTGFPTLDASTISATDGRLYYVQANTLYSLQPRMPRTPTNRKLHFTLPEACSAVVNLLVENGRVWFTADDSYNNIPIYSCSLAAKNGECKVIAHIPDYPSYNGYVPYGLALTKVPSVGAEVICSISPANMELYCFDTAKGDLVAHSILFPNERKNAFVSMQASPNGKLYIFPQLQQEAFMIDIESLIPHNSSEPQLCVEPKWLHLSALRGGANQAYLLYSLQINPNGDVVVASSNRVSVIPETEISPGFGGFYVVADVDSGYCTAGLSQQVVAVASTASHTYHLLSTGRKTSYQLIKASNRGVYPESKTVVWQFEAQSSRVDSDQNPQLVIDEVQGSFYISNFYNEWWGDGPSCLATAKIPAHASASMPLRCIWNNTKSVVQAFSPLFSNEGWLHALVRNHGEQHNTGPYFLWSYARTTMAEPIQGLNLTAKFGINNVFGYAADTTHNAVFIATTPANASPDTALVYGFLVNPGPHNKFDVQPLPNSPLNVSLPAAISEKNTDWLGLGAHFTTGKSVMVVIHRRESGVAYINWDITVKHTTSLKMIPFVSDSYSQPPDKGSVESNGAVWFDFTNNLTISTFTPLTSERMLVVSPLHHLRGGKLLAAKVSPESTRAPFIANKKTYWTWQHGFSVANGRMYFESDELPDSLWSAEWNPSMWKPSAPSVSASFSVCAAMPGNWLAPPTQSSTTNGTTLWLSLLSGGVLVLPTQGLSDAWQPTVVSPVLPDGSPCYVGGVAQAVDRSTGLFYALCTPIHWNYKAVQRRGGTVPCHLISWSPTDSRVATILATPLALPWYSEWTPLPVPLVVADGFAFVLVQGADPAPPTQMLRVPLPTGSGKLNNWSLFTELPLEKGDQPFKFIGGP